MIVGVGCSLGCPTAELLALIDATVRAARAPVAAGGAAAGRVATLATVDRRRGEPCVVDAAAALGASLVTFAADELARVAVPTPSDVVARHVGTPSVAEAAALLAAGPGARIVVPKRRSAHATCAVAA